MCGISSKQLHKMIQPPQFSSHIKYEISSMIDDTDSAYLQVGTLLSSTGHLFLSFS